MTCVITCAVTDRLREKMLLKPSDLKLLEESDNMMTSYRDDGYTFENSWYDMMPLAERVERVGMNGDENEGVASEEDVVSENDSVETSEELDLPCGGGLE